MFVFVFLYSFVFPLTNTFLYIDYYFSRSPRQNIVNQLIANEQVRYQIGNNKYQIPYRSITGNNNVYIQQANGVTKIMFSVYTLGKHRLIYESDDNGVHTGDFTSGSTQEYIEIMRIEENWYYVKDDISIKKQILILRI